MPMTAWLLEGRERMLSPDGGSSIIFVRLVTVDLNKGSCFGSSSVPSSVSGFTWHPSKGTVGKDAVCSPLLVRVDMHSFLAAFWLPIRSGGTPQRS
jgi:hypothetical protein